jgi:ankyrin repeat protein
MNEDLIYFKGPSKEKLEARLVNMSLEDQFKKAIENNQVWLVQRCIDNGVDPSVGNNCAIQWASYYGYLEVVKIILNDKRVDPTTNYNYAIQWASYNGHIEVVKILLNDHRVDPTAYNNWAIWWASGRGHLEVVKTLLKDKRVRDKLSPKLKKKYAKYLK